MPRADPWPRRSPDRVVLRRRRRRAGHRARAPARGARGPPSRAAARRADRREGHLRRRWHADHRWRAALRAHPAGGGFDGGGAAARGRRDHRRQNRHDRVRVSRSGADAEPVEHGPHPRRLVGGLGGGHRGSHDPAGPRLANGRLGAAARRLLRRRRVQGHARAGAGRRRDPARVVARPRRRAGALRHRRRARDERPRRPQRRAPTGEHAAPGAGAGTAPARHAGARGTHRKRGRRPLACRRDRVEGRAAAVLRRDPRRGTGRARSRGRGVS